MINTHLIIGRLGSGKTSCIKHLITHKPENERWAILVNEFGQIGLDAALLETSPDDEIQITEIAGGCICCAAKSQLRISLNNLIKTHQPDRLIIEATGLGHPAAIIDLLRDEFMKKIIDINSVITVVDLTLFGSPYDAANKKSPLTTESFSQQTQLADIIILNKSDLAEKENIINAKKYLETIYPKKNQIIQSHHGEVPVDILLQTTRTDYHPLNYPEISDSYKSDSDEFMLGQYTVKSYCSETNDFLSFGFIFPADIIFNRKSIETFIEEKCSRKSTDIVRLKAVLNCGKFWYAFNVSDMQIERYESFYRRDSRIEFITSNKQTDIDKFKTLLIDSIKLPVK